MVQYRIHLARRPISTTGFSRKPGCLEKKPRCSMRWPTRSLKELIECANVELESTGAAVRARSARRVRGSDALRPWVRIARACACRHPTAAAVPKTVYIGRGWSVALPRRAGDAVPDRRQ